MITYSMISMSRRNGCGGQVLITFSKTLNSSANHIPSSPRPTSAPSSSASRCSCANDTKWFKIKQGKRKDWFTSCGTRLKSGTQARASCWTSHITRTILWDLTKYKWACTSATRPKWSSRSTSMRMNRRACSSTIRGIAVASRLWMKCDSLKNSLDSAIQWRSRKKAKFNKNTGNQSAGSSRTTSIWNSGAIIQYTGKQTV